MSSKFQELVAAELAKARARYPMNFVDAHHGFAKMKEEVDEVWDEVRRNESDGSRRDEAMLKELVQVAAMAQRMAEDIGLLPGKPHRLGVRNCPRCNTPAVIADGYCGGCRGYTLPAVRVCEPAPRDQASWGSE